MTAFTRIVIVFHFLRQALGTQQMPSNQILLGLALFLTMFIMAPVAVEVNTSAVQPVVTGEIGLTEAMGRAVPPVREFMLVHTRQNDLALFSELADTASELPMRVVIPAFVISELKTGFQMGFFLFVPVPADRPGRVDHAAVDGNAAASTDDDLATVQSDALRHDRRLESAR